MKPAASHGALITVDIDIRGSIYFVGLVDLKKNRKLCTKLETTQCEWLYVDGIYI